MSDPVGGREAEIEAALDRIEWYVQCLRDAWLGHAVRGMDEARAGYDSALDALRSSGSAAQNQEDPRIHVLENELRIAREKVEVWEREFHRLAARSSQDEEMDHAWLLRNAPQGLPAPVGDREGAIREVVAFLRSRAPVAQPRHGADHAFTRLRPRMGSTVMTTYSQGYYSVPEDEYERLLIARARLEEIEKIFNAGYLSRLPGEGAASLKGPALARLRGLIHDHEEHT